MRKAFSTSLFNFLSLLPVFVLVLAVNYGASAQCTMVCNDLVQISLDQTCVFEVQPDDILEGGACPNGVLQVQAKINGVWTPANGAGNWVATSANINQTIQVRVRDAVSGNTCWGYAHIEDKLAPQLTCEDITLPCAITNYTPDYLFNVLGITEAYPDVEENCSNYTLTYLDTWHDLNCTQTINGITGLSAYVTRKWTATDASGNSAVCTQFIYFDRRGVTDVIFPADITVSCEDPITNPLVTGVPYVLDFGVQFPLYPSSSFCELNVTYTDQILPVCDGTHKILRTWIAYDWCSPTSNFPPFTNPLYYIQLIKVLDDVGPDMECPDNITESTNSNGCCAVVNLPDIIISDNCSRIKTINAMITTFDPETGQQTGMYAVGGNLTTFPGNNFWLPDTLAAFGSTPCLPVGTHTVLYTAQDDCGNTSTCSFHLTVEDQNPPTAVCDQFTKVALGANGMALVNALTFDDGSYDDCNPVHFKVRRMDANDCQDNNVFSDQVKFCCEDIGDTITVILRVYDVTVDVGDVGLSYQEEHANDCMVQVFVEDKIKPTCQSPANMTVSCENFDPSLWVYGIPIISDNCCLDSSKVYQGQIGLTHTVSYTQFDTLCNKGTITRTFRSYDCGGNSSQCTQRIIVNYEQDYFVRFPDDKIVTICDGTGTYGEPTFANDQDCELLGVSYQDVIYTVVPDACYKIERTWTIINWCTYNPNLPCIDVPNPNPNATTNHPSNLPGPIVSACGTPAPWNPTVVKINPGDPGPTNYCTFYDANANCYKYKQIIKVIDGVAPVINCPASPVEICDLTANDPLFWNEMYWWDNTIGSHDLCEAPADLCITATDACSGSDITVRYLLFLDLDGDGIMETVLSSSNLPGFNNVNYNNYQNQNFGGGTPRSFDERPVPFNQKYGFALQTTVNGANKTACVRWNTAQSPNTFVIPQLPYGTHKIKWIVGDGCGNERVCEYTFIVRDCKKPTVVCLNGLSVNIMPTGMITLWASDFLQYTEDNCTPSPLLKIGIVKSAESTGTFPVDGNGNPITSVTFTCAELGTQPVQLWSIDLAGNADFCETYVIVQDNMGACDPNNQQNATVAGILKTENQVGLEEGVVQLEGTHPALPPVSMFDMSDNTGVYAFPNAIPMAGSYTLTPTDDDNPLNGVTTYDLVLMSKHILGLQPLTSPYAQIAADINNSQSITTYDIVELRKLILGIYTELPSNASWRFVDKAFVFPDPANAFQTAFPETKSVADVQASHFTDDFVSVKIGDVNASAIPNSLVQADDRSAGTLFIDAADRTVKAGETFEVSFKANQPAQGFQFTMGLEGLEVVNIVESDRVKASNFGVFNEKSALTASVDGANEFTVQFRARKAGQLSDMLNLSSNITKSEAYVLPASAEATAGKPENYEVALRFKGENGTVVAGAGFELLQNTPNPVKGETTISFNLPEASDATLTISNAEGRVLKVVKGAYGKGLNTVTLQRSDLAAGMLFYQLDTPTHSAVKKMVVVE